MGHFSPKNAFFCSKKEKKYLKKFFLKLNGAIGAVKNEKYPGIL